jgi:tetratricopeptide (TPR) repeat protein
MLYRAIVFLFGIMILAHAASAQPLARAHHPVSTSSKVAQAYFDQGLTLIYSFNRTASRHAFQRAAAADPRLAMAYWGIALSYGPNINEGTTPDGERAAMIAIARAQSLAVGGGTTGEERAFIAALAQRYSDKPQSDGDALGRAYCSAMRAVFHKYPDDSDAAALFAESEMDLHPWALYTTAGVPIEGTAEIISALDTALARDPEHIGANHFLIHATEASKSPERALPSAFRLRRMAFEPAAAHLVHMPAHTFMRTGDYANAVASNVAATMHDRSFMNAMHDREGGAYFGHDLFFLSSAATMQGDFITARRAAAEMVGQDAVEPLLFVYMRFGRWHDILAMPQPKESANEPLRTPVWRFARGMASVDTGDVDSARADLAAVEQFYNSMNVPSVNGFNNGSHQILGVARDLLGARLAWIKSDRQSAIERLADAVTIQDSFLYIEPPDWYGPAREALGAALCEAGDFSRAERVFRDDLARNPRNPRSLFGLSAALEGEGNVDDAAYVKAQFKRGWVGGPLSIDNLF